jgi:NAD(P)-dependent dehydrogenase (short-subunit alcohol dehydrogenase family)
MLAANLATAHATLAALLPSMVSRKRGSVVVVGSTASVRPWESAGSAAYAASKAAVVALAQATAAEVHPAGVRVNAILPSTIDTPQNRAGMPDADFSKWVTAASIAGVVSFLLSANLNYRSVGKDEECCVVGLCADNAARLSEQFEHDCSRSARLSLNEWRARGWTLRIRERLARLIVEQL